MKFRNHPIMIASPFLVIIAFIAWIVFSTLERLVEGDLRPKDLWTGLSGHIKGDFLAYIFDQRIPSLIFLGLVVILVASLVKTFFEWKNSYINLGEHSIFYTRQGLFSKVHKEVNFTNIANVNIRTGIVYGVLGLCVLTIDINSSATANDLDYKMYLSRKNAQIIKDWVMASKTDRGDIEVDDKAPSQDLSSYRFRSSQAIGHFFMDINLFHIVLFIGAIVALISKVVAIFALINIGIIKGFLSKMDGLYDFTVKRYPDHIHINYGLFKARDFTIPIENISSVGYQKSFIGSILGYRYLTLDAIGYGNEENENRLLSLYMKDESVGDFMDRIIPEFSLDQLGGDFIRKPTFLIKYYLPLFSLIFVLVAVLVGLPLGKYWTGLLGLPLAILASLYMIFGGRMLLTETDLIIKKGILSTKTILIPISQIEMINIGQNPIYKKLGVYSLTIYKKDPQIGKTVEETGPYPIGIFDKIFNYYMNGEIN
ncbi:PH domain-containing protein [Peptostreptococcus stomatis]|uniref:PH domain-containing protein n=1 Tax=Peptostreptococcus stomatis TaxID=341694 RepID=UPI0026EFA5B8|nr:PH domain-containing protein [Peptostreptococcus stomatis]